MKRSSQMQADGGCPQSSASCCYSSTHRVDEVISDSTTVRNVIMGLFRSQPHYIPKVYVSGKLAYSLLSAYDVLVLQDYTSDQWPSMPYVSIAVPSP